MRLKKKTKKEEISGLILFQTIICRNCGKSHKISYPQDIVWETGTIICEDCNRKIEYTNDRLDTLFM